MSFFGLTFLGPPNPIEPFKVHGALEFHTIADKAYEEMFMKYALAGSELADDLRRAVGQLADRAEVGAVVLQAAGPHFCVGANVARLEVNIMLELLSRNCPNHRLSSDPIVWEENMTFRTMKSLWLERI